jgi:hypothetical protein
MNPAQRPGKSVSTWGAPPSKRKVWSWSDSTDKNVEGKVYRLKDTDEYMVELRAYGVHRPQADYFTDDLDDAKATARSMVKRVIAMKRQENPAQSPALGMSKKAYVNRKSQITKAKPDPRLKKRRNYAYLMAQRGFKGAFPNPLGESKWQWVDYDVWGNAEDGYNVNQEFRTTHKVMLKDDAKLADMLKALRTSGVLGSKATTKSVRMFDEEGVILFYATEDDYPLGELRKID